MHEVRRTQIIMEKGTNCSHQSDESGRGIDRERIARLFETHAIARSQIQMQRSQRMEEQILRGEAVDTAPTSMSYTVDTEGNVTNLIEGPQERVTLGGRGADGSYKVLGEMPPRSGLFKRLG